MNPFGLPLASQYLHQFRKVGGWVFQQRASHSSSTALLLGFQSQPALEFL